MKEREVSYQIHWYALGNFYGEHLSLKCMQMSPLSIHLHTVRVATWRSVFSCLAPLISLPTTKKACKYQNISNLCTSVTGCAERSG